MLAGKSPVNFGTIKMERSLSGGQPVIRKLINIPRTSQWKKPGGSVGVPRQENNSPSLELQTIEDTNVPSNILVQEPVQKKQNLGPPQPGQAGPAGCRDDPYRRGLSGAATKWYMRFLQQGFTAQEARMKVEERKQKTNLELRNENNNQVRPYNRKTNNLTVSILAEHPGVTLSKHDLTLIQASLVHEMGKVSEFPLQFDGLLIKVGVLVIDCVTEQTAEWLIKMVPNIKLPKGYKLATSLLKNTPRTHMLTLDFSRTASLARNALSQIKSINVGLNTEVWKEHESRQVGDSLLVSFHVDAMSVATLVKNDFTIYYKSEKIPVDGVSTLMEKQKGQMDSDNQGVDAP